MQEGRHLTERQINRDLLRSVLATPRWYWPAVTFFGLVVLAAIGFAGFTPVKLCRVPRSGNHGLGAHSFN